MLNLQYLQNCLANAIRSHVAKYYEGWMLCEDPRCSFRTKTVSSKVEKDKPAAGAFDKTWDIAPEHVDVDPVCNTLSLSIRADAYAAISLVALEVSY